MKEQRHELFNGVDSSKCIEILKRYKKLSSNPSNHSDLLKDKTLLLFIANLLDSRNKEILLLCIDILQDFVNFDKYHKIMQNSFSLFKVLNELAIRLRQENCELAEKVFSILEKMSHAMLSYSRDYCYTIDLPDLNEKTRHFYENIFLSIKGIRCWGTDLENKCCVIRIYRTVTIIQILDKLREELGMTPFLRIPSYELNINKGTTQIKANNDAIVQLENSFKAAYLNTKIMNFIRKVVILWNMSFYW